MAAPIYSKRHHLGKHFLKYVKNVRTSTCRKAAAIYLFIKIFQFAFSNKVKGSLIVLHVF